MKTGANKRKRATTFEVTLPASTSNLGAGFDCFGLALQQYLTIRATVTPQATAKCRVRTRGTKDSSELPRTSENLIYRAMAYTARLEGVSLPPIHLAVQNQIPLGRGLGSSAAAIAGGITLSSLICKREMSVEKVLEYATRFEGHPDNVAAALFGGFVVTCLAQDGSVLALKRPWPAGLKIIIVSPNFRVATKLARDVFPRVVNRSDAVHNLQRSALFVASLAEGRHELLWEAMRDRIHQERRQTLVPGLTEVLALPRMPGLLGVALSGAGPSVVAVATENFEGISEVITDCFRRKKVGTTSQRLEVDSYGCRVAAIGG
jgi:homoserine kinase